MKWQNIKSDISLFIIYFPNKREIYLMRFLSTYVMRTLCQIKFIQVTFTPI